MTLGERLVKQEIISPDDLNRVIRLQQEQRISFVRLVVELGFVSEDDLLPVLSKRLSIPYLSLKEFPSTSLSASRLMTP